MPGIGDLQGTPWHVEKMARAEGDERRHRSHCVNYDKNTKHCSITQGGCWGASHCKHYSPNAKSDNPETEEKITQKSISYSWKADQESIKIANLMSDLKEFTKMIKSYALKELGFTVLDTPASLNDVKPLFGSLIENMNIPEAWPTSANLRYIVLSVLKKYNYSITPSTYLNPLDVMSILPDIANSKIEDKKYDLLFLECEMRIVLCQQKLMEINEMMQWLSLHKEGDYERLKNLCLSIRDIQQLLSCLNNK